MQDDTLPLNNSNATTTPLSTRLPFTKYDFGWVLLCIGMVVALLLFNGNVSSCIEPPAQNIRS
ncbi:hypothetical protein, partial [Salmonella enterica]|uniref:hypothetical protein n=1 Tax=Salmonella enterica TaxID=28901 RepID=UPI002AFDD59F